MKGLLISALVLLLCVATTEAITFNGVPQVINYQGRLTDAGGTPLADGAHSVRFIIWYDSTSTSPVNIAWDSGPMTVTTDKGIFSVKLGSPPQPTLGTIPFYDSLLFLGITVGADPEQSPRTRLTSVPFAYSANNALNANTAGTAYTLTPSSMPAAGTVTVYLNSTNSTSPTQVGQFSVTVPGGGYLTMNASGMMYIDKDASTASAATGYYYVGLCSTPGSSGSCGNTYSNHWSQDADNADPNNPTPTYSLNATFYVPTAGTYAYYINAASESSSYFVYPWAPCIVNVLFTPATLTITSPTPPQPPAQKQQN